MKDSTIPVGSGTTGTARRADSTPNRNKAADIRTPLLLNELGFLTAAVPKQTGAATVAEWIEVVR